MTGQQAQTSSVVFTGADGTSKTVTVRYLLYLPAAYGRDAEARWPLLLFLHGRGERGDDLQLLTKHPLPQTLAAQADFPFIVVSPQLPGELQSWTAMIEPLNALIDEVEARYSTDPSRRYLTGLSLGGFGTWEFAFRHPRRFAAVAPIAGGFSFGTRSVPSRVSGLTDLPIWAFHGALDQRVSCWQSEVLVTALRARGSDIRFTRYEDGDHEAAWRRAYADPELFRWLLDHVGAP